MSAWTEDARILVLGAGYSASRFLRRLPERPTAVTATARSAETAAKIRAAGWTPIAFDGSVRSPELAAAIAEATHIVTSIAPDESGDPFLRHHAGDVARAPRIAAIAYLSTIGVYGDHDGGWVDEETPARPGNIRSERRLGAEQAWQEAADAASAPLSILRLSGIYGPGRNAFVNLASGNAHRIIKPGQVFNRIHVDDIAAAIDAALAAGTRGIVNVTDNEPGPPQDVVAYAAFLMGVAPPAEVAFEDAGLSPMGLSFYGENKRVRNARLKVLIGDLAFPTYREGLATLWETGGWREAGAD